MSYAEPVNVTAANADTKLSDFNDRRVGLIISNDSTAKLYVLIDEAGGNAASGTNFSYVVGAGATLELPLSGPGALISYGRIRGFWSAANGSAGVTEIT